MTMQDTDLSTRLYQLERQLKFWQTLTVLTLILCAAGMATHLGATPTWIKTTRVDATAIVAHEFDLVNATGRVTARLAPDPDNLDFPEFVLKYPNDKPAIHLSVNNKNVKTNTFASISLLNTDGAPRAMMTENANGPSLTLFDEDARIRIEVDALKPGPQISIYDKARKRTVVAFSD
jgi:hypothetical protein